MFNTEVIIETDIYWIESKLKEYANSGTLHSWNVTHKLDYLNRDEYTLIVLYKED